MMAGLFTLVLLLRYSIEKCSNYSTKECQCVLNKCLKNLTIYWKRTFFMNWHPSQRDWWSSWSFHATKRGLSSNRAARRFEPLGSSGICAFTLLNTNKTRSFFSTCSLWNLEGLGGSGSHFNFYRRWVDVLFATRKMMKINRRETKDEAMTLMTVTMMTLMTMTLFKVTRESHVSSEFQNVINRRGN